MTRTAAARSFTARLGLELPVVQAPLPDPRREAAWRAALRAYYEELGVPESAIQAGPGRLPFGEEAVAAVEALRPEVVSFHFGLPPAPLLDRRP